LQVMNDIVFRPIGYIHSPFKEPKDMPIQPAGAAGVEGTIEVLPEFVSGLEDIEGFSHLFLLYHFHRASGYALRVVPFLDTVEHGLFSTRAPRRPNGIGLSIVRLLGREGAVLRLQDVDILDGTPLLDIKPYVPGFDCFPDAARGWLEGKDLDAATWKSDGRFHKG